MSIEKIIIHMLEEVAKEKITLCGGYNRENERMWYRSIEIIFSFFLEGGQIIKSQDNSEKLSYFPSINKMYLVSFPYT